jgi:hypothetical protein
MSTRQFDAAEVELRHAATLKPDLPDLAVLHAYALREQNEPDAAIAALRARVGRRRQHMHASIAEALMLPPIYSGGDDLRRWRGRFESGLARLGTMIPAWQRNPLPVLDLEWSNFLLAYQGQNDLALQRGYSGVLAALLGAAVPELLNVRDRRVTGAEESVSDSCRRNFAIPRSAATSCAGSPTSRAIAFTSRPFIPAPRPTT